MGGQRREEKGREMGEGREQRGTRDGKVLGLNVFISLDTARDRIKACSEKNTFYPQPGRIHCR